MKKMANIAGASRKEETMKYVFVVALAFAGGVVAGCGPLTSGQQPVGEICGDDVDNDGDGLTDEGCQEADAGPEEDGGLEDQDHDGFSPDQDADRRDCDDTKSWIHPGAKEVCNDVDDDCDGDVDESPCDDPECREDRDCDSGEVCRDNVCVPDRECRINSDCASDEACEDGRCVENVVCREDRDCDRGEVCRANACVPDVECVLDSDCLLGERCEDGTCIEDVECRQDRDCRIGQVCRSNRCEDGDVCRLNSDCASDEVCDAGDCVSEPVECREDRDCDSGEVCRDNVCVPDRECRINSDCDDREICDPDDRDADSFGCVRVECTDDAHCSDGNFCNGIERCGADYECSGGTTVDCSDGRADTVDSCNEAFDRCDHSLAAVEVCDGADNDGDAVADEGFACVLGSSEACAIDGCGLIGRRTCFAGCVWGACIPPAEVCGDARDNDCDGSIEEGCGGATRHVVCTFTTEGGVVFDRVNVNGCYGLQRDGFFECEGPALDGGDHPTWGDPIPGCSAVDLSSVTCTVDVPVGRRFRFNPHYYDLGGAQTYGCEGTPNRDRDEDPGTVTCTVDGVAVTFDDGDGVAESREMIEVATDFGGGCNLDITLP